MRLYNIKYITDIFAIFNKNSIKVHSFIGELKLRNKKVLEEFPKSFPQVDVDKVGWSHLAWQFFYFVLKRIYRLIQDIHLFCFLDSVFIYLTPIHHQANYGNSIYFLIFCTICTMASGTLPTEGETAPLRPSQILQKIKDLSINMPFTCKPTKPKSIPSTSSLLNLHNQANISPALNHPRTR